MLFRRDDQDHLRPLIGPEFTMIRIRVGVHEIARPEPAPARKDAPRHDEALFGAAVMMRRKLRTRRDVEQQRAVKQALDTLPPDQRVLIEQAYFLGLTQSELAERFKLPLGTVKTRIRTGILALREKLSHVFIAQ